MDFNSVLERVGDYGRFQKFLMFIFFTLVNVYGSFSYWAQIFILLVPDHACQMPRGQNDTSYHAGQCGWTSTRPETLNASIPETFLPARGFPVYFSSFFGMGSYLQQDDNATLSPGAVNALTCSHWSYDYSILFPTIASESNWVCDDSWKVSFAHTCYWIGSTLGYLLAGFIVDSLGRRFSVGVFACSLGLSHLASIFAPNYVTFVLCRLVAGMSALPMQSSSYALVIELIGTRKRVMASVGSAIYWLGLGVVFPWMAYFIRDWKVLLVLSSAPVCVLLPMLKWWVPESPSWLLGRGDIERAKSELIRISKINGTYNESFFDTLKMAQPNTNGQSEGFFKTTMSLVRTKNIRKNTLVLFFAWLFVCMSYHGINLSQSSAGSQVYLVYSLGSLLEIPVLFLHLLAVDRVGRRLPIIAGLACVAILGPATSYVKSDSLWMGFAISIVIRGLFSLAYNILFQLANEIFPTSLRGRGVCLMRMLGDVGTSVSPFIISMSAKSQPSLPVFVFSALAVVGGALTLRLPETLHQPLPQTAQDAEDFGLDQGTCFCPIMNYCKPRNLPSSQQSKDKDFGQVNPGFTPPKVDEDMFI